MEADGCCLFLEDKKNNSRFVEALQETICRQIGFQEK
jgi:hypothetical protein